MKTQRITKKSTTGRATTTKKVIEVLTPNEVIQLVAAAGGGKTGTRNRALVIFMYSTALRVAEVTGITAKHVDLAACAVNVPAYCAKYGKPRRVMFAPSIAPVLATWMELRRSLGIKDTEPLFPCVSSRGLGNQMMPRQVHKMLSDMARRAGIKKRIHPHNLRHSAAVYWADNGMDLRVIQRQLGHSSLAVTDRYVQHLSSKQQMEAVAAMPEVAF